jgi:hypothetical protein
MRWFGKPWGAEACDPASHVETPVGEICMWCDEPIAEEDRGFLMPHLGAAVTMRAHHLECYLRSILGGLNHLEGRCACHRKPGGLPPEPPDPPGMTRREAAVAAARAARTRGAWI